MLKSIVKSLSPQIFGWLQKRRSELASRRHLARINSVYATIGARFNYQVLTGPFSGMRYFPAPINIDRTPFLVGCYEAELHSAIEQICAGHYRCVIDIGCAEGYYAVGLARRMPSADVYAFDIDENARALCAKLSALNLVSDRVRIRCECTHQSLNELVTDAAIIFSDCEGCEGALLDPIASPNLKKCDIVVELHDHLMPGVGDSIRSRFAESHEMESIFTAPRQVPAELSFLSAPQRDLAVAEYRGVRQEWLVLRSRKTQK
jgi:hypothetical protein